MHASREIRFVKYHAAANDFVVVSAAELALGSAIKTPPAQLTPLARAILDRHTGVGADGLFVAWRATGSNRAAVRIFNADGSEAEMSGNGIRCAAAWLLEGKSMIKQIEIETAAGLKTLERVQDNGETMVFRVAMGGPILDPQRIPFRGPAAAAPVVGYSLPTSLGPRQVSVSSMGNPHCSTFVDSFDELDWRALGREMERHPFFPNRTNVEFIRVLGQNRIEVRFWERGVGETLSSGTGSSAAAVASILNQKTRRRVAVETPGGTLNVEWKQSDEVFLTGPVRRIAAGKFEYHEEANARKSGRFRR